MTEYRIIPDGLKAYGVEIASPNLFLSVRGFATELEAAMSTDEQRAGRLQKGRRRVPARMVGRRGPEPLRTRPRSS
jgi:hypothetical protein